MLRELGEPRQHHELQSRHILGSPLWEDGSSSFPAFQPGLNLDQLSFFQVNQLKSPGAAESIRHSLLLLQCGQQGSCSLQLHLGGKMP